MVVTLVSTQLALSSEVITVHVPFVSLAARVIAHPHQQLIVQFTTLELISHLHLKRSISIIISW